MNSADVLNQFAIIRKRHENIHTYYISPMVNKPVHFSWISGNPADPIWIIYLKRVTFEGVELEG